jgi:hypothetical protein
MSTYQLSCSEYGFTNMVLVADIPKHMRGIEYFPNNTSIRHSQRSRRIYEKMQVCWHKKLIADSNLRTVFEIPGADYAKLI